MKAHRFAVMASALTFASLLGSVPAATAQSTPYCGITWGSLQKTASAGSGAPIVGARVGRQDCYDRLVVDLSGMPAAGYNVRYTDWFAADGSGDRLPVTGGAILTITVLAPAYDANYQSTVPWRNGTHIVTPQQFTAGGFRTFRDLVFGGSFEGQSKLGLGVRARLPFRVLKLDGPGSGSRLVIDVAHQW
jgi:hypothetical protein